ncbi:MAG TPA: GYF domain-containing protein [Pirellulales bacterium]
MRLASGDQYGPAKSAEMREWLDQSRIPGDALVWREGWADWKRADETFASLAPTSAAPGPAIPAMPAGYPGAAPPGMAPAPLMPGAYPMPGAPVPGAMPGMMAPGMVVPGMPMPGAAVPAMPHTGAPMGMPAAGAPLVHPAPGAFPGAMPMAAPPGAMPAAPVGAYPVGMAAPGAVRAAVAVPVATAPVGASPLAAPSTPEDGDTGEFLAAAAGQSRRSESSEPVRPRKKSNAVAVTMTVMMVLAAIGLGGFAYYLITQEKGYNPVVVENANVGVKFAFPRSATAGETPENVKSPAGAVSYTVREADGLGYNFFAIIIEVPNREEAAAKKDELLTFGGELAAKRVGAAKGTSGRAVSLSGNSGREFTAESGGRQVRARAYMIRNYLCVLGLSGEEEKDLRNGVVAKQFFESIKIN